MKNGHNHVAKVGILGAIASAIFGSGILLAISCCAGPIVFLGIGLGWAGLTRFQALAPYRWIFFALTGIFLTMAFYKLYFSKPACVTSGDCTVSRTLQYQRITLWTSVLIIVASLLFPVLSELYLLR
jgi:mercuric ion transport protein